MREHTKKWWILFAMCLLTTILNIDVAGINIAIPTIASEFHANLPSMQWVINIYVLMSAALQILGGRLGDTYSHKKIYLIGASLFILSSLGAGLSPNEQILIFFRTLQGIALGIGYPATIILTLNAFPKNQQGFAMSFIVTTMGVFLALGPILGGLFVHYLSWRWIFYINIPIGLLSLILAWIFCPNQDLRETKAIDYRGAFLLTFGLIALIIPLNQLQIWGFDSFKFWIWIAVSAILLLKLYFLSKRQSYPILDFSLFKIRNFSLNNLLRVITQLIFIPVIFFVPIYLQNIASFNALDSGIMMLYLTLAIAVGAPLAGLWVDKVGDKIPNFIAMFLFSSGTFLFVFLKSNPNLILLAFSLSIIGIATAITFVSTVTGSVVCCAEKQHGVASGILFTNAWLGCALGVTIMGSILALSGSGYFDQQIHKFNIALSVSEVQQLHEVTTGVRAYSNVALSQNLQKSQIIKNLARNSFVHGFKRSMLVYFILALLGIVLSLSLKKIKPSLPSNQIPHLF